MKSIVALALVTLTLFAAAGSTPVAGEGAPVFRAVDVWVDAGDARLAAWQIEISYDRATTKILSLEGGATAAYRDAPHHDRRGLEGGRIVIAAFSSTDVAAPSGRTRVARLHLRTTGEAAAPTARLVTAARPGGAKLTATVTLADPAADDEGK